MANAMFADRREFLAHVATGLMSARRADQLFERFENFGSISRQERTGLSVGTDANSGSWVGDVSVQLAASPYRTQVVVVSNAFVTEAEFDKWADVVRQWSASISDAARGAWAREIKNMKKVNNGIPLSVLHKGMPSNLYFTYPRASEYVAVIDPPDGGKREIFATKGIG